MMDKKIFLTALVIVLSFLSSCITSLQRLVTYSTVATDNRITGNWQYEDLSINIESIPGSLFLRNVMASIAVSGEKKSAYESKEDSLLYSKSYVIDFTRKGYHYYMICSLIKMGDALFANIEPVDARPLNETGEKDMDDLFRGGSYISTHSIAKIVFRANHMEFRFLNSDFIRHQLMNGRVGIKYEKNDLFQTSLITASSNDLQQFLSKYGNDERLYNKENTVTLNKI